MVMMRCFVSGVFGGGGRALFESRFGCDDGCWEGKMGFLSSPAYFEDLCFPSHEFDSSSNGHGRQLLNLGNRNQEARPDTEAMHRLLSLDVRFGVVTEP